MIKIVLDAFGGDRSPVVNVEGAVKAVNEKQDMHVILTGDKERLEDSRLMLVNINKKYLNSFFLIIVR